MIDTLQKHRLIVLPSAIASFAIIAVGLLTYDTPRLEWQHAARWTADWSAILFLSIFVPQLRQILPRIDRRQRVLGFATAHLVHAGAFIVYHLHSNAPNLTTVILGGLGYAMMGALVLIPPPSAPRMHRIGIWYIWFIFLATFASGFENTERQIGAIVGVAAFLAAAVLRLFYLPGSARK
ncbi:MAG: hypothetical protein IBJ12_05985 [Sphingomonadaceae bacterium]|nr:hypothetical protein [Sphingomonadaceae bacterium]